MHIRMLLLCLAISWVCCGTGPVEPDLMDTPTPAFEDIPKIDFHSHVFVDIPEMVRMMEKNNLHIINICVRGTNLENLKLAQQRAEEIFRKYPAQFAYASTFDLTRRNEPDYIRSVTDWLDHTYESGAVMTKIWKEVGMEIKSPEGKFILPDDPLFDPIYDHIASRGKPLLAHLAEPIAAWLPLDPESTHYGYYSQHPEWHLYGRDEYPSWEELIAARDRILEKHPDLVFVGAHNGSMSHDVDEVARRLDRYPNFYVEVSARTRDLSRQPTEKVRNFFIRYQDRILYGTDQSIYERKEGELTDQQKQAFVRSAEARYRRDFHYYAETGKVEMAGKEVDGLGLPEEVLRKFYYENARKLIPDLPF